MLLLILDESTLMRIPYEEWWPIALEKKQHRTQPSGTLHHLGQIHQPLQNVIVRITVVFWVCQPPPPSQHPKHPTNLPKLPPFKDLKSSPTLGRRSCQARLATAGSPAGAAAPTGAPRPHPRGKIHRAWAFGQRWSPRLLVSSWCVVRPLISKKLFCHPNTKMHHLNDFKLPATCSLSSPAP